MIFNLIAQAMSTGAVIALFVGGVVVLALAIFGIILAVREPKRRKTKTVVKQVKAEEPAQEVVEEKEYDFTNLSEEEKDIIRKHRDQSN